MYSSLLFTDQRADHHYMYSTNPVLSLRFDNTTANVSLNGYFLAQNALPEEETNSSDPCFRVEGRLTIGCTRGLWITIILMRGI